MFDGAHEALVHLLTWQSFLLLVIATTVGSVAAILPGISVANMMALLLPITFGMDKYDSFMFLVALMAAGGFAGSMTSILLNVPGDGINAATCLDGFPLARQGKAGVAIGASATASGLGALFGLVLLVLSLPFIRNLILVFGPPEFFALTIAGISLIATVSARSPLKGLIAGLIGMLLGFVGVNYTVGGTRYTFGILELQDGIALTPALIGLFALPELFDLLRSNQTISSQGYTVAGGVWQGVMEVLKRPGLFLRSAGMGTVLGIIPGVGQSVASWVSYFAAVNNSKDPKSFGTGNIEGVIAPEATIDAKEGASMMPVLALGLPAGISTAILLSAFQIHGVFPGQRLFQQDMPLVWVMILAMVFSNVTTSILGLTFANAMVKLTVIPAVVMAPIIFVLGAVGSYADQQSMFGITMMLVFGLLGLAMVRRGYPRPPLLVGMILAPLAEENFHLSLQIYRGSYDFLLRPITIGILVLTAIAFALPWLQALWRRRAQRLDPHLSQEAEGAIDPTVDEDDESASAGPEASLKDVLFPVLLLGIIVIFWVQSFDFPPKARLFPSIVLVPLTALLVWRIVKVVRAWRAAPHAATSEESGEVPAHSDWWIGAWVLALPALIWLIGAVPAVGVYTAAFLLGFKPRLPSISRVAWSIVGGAMISVTTYYVFIQWLGMRFNEGILG